MEAYEASLAAFLQWLLKATLQGSLLICLILLTKLILRERLPARWHYALWLILLVRLALPWTPQSRISIYNLVPRSLPSRDMTVAAGVHGDDGGAEPGDPGQERRVERVGGVDEGTASGQSQAGPSEPAAQLPASAASSKGIAWDVGRRVYVLAAATLLWLAGVAILAACVLVKAVRLWLGVRSERPVTDQQILDLLEDCKLQMRVRTLVGVVVTDKIATPALFGFVRPRILLPQGLIETLDLDELHDVFLHELAHLKRRDIYLAWLVCLLQILHWFNPLIWYAFRRMRADQEIAADALALATAGTGESRRYGQTIVRLLGRFSRPQYVPSLAGILENRSHIERRIKMIAEYKGSTRRPLLAVMLLAVLGLMTLTDAQTNKSDVSKSTADEGAGRRQPVIQTLVTGGAAETAGVLCPDESMIAYVDWDNPDGSTALMVKELASGQRHVLAESELIESTGDHAFAHPVVWSPDSKWLAYGWHGERTDLRIGSVPSGPSRVLKAHDPEVEYAPEDWSSNGEWLLCVLDKKDRSHALGVVSVAGGHHEELAHFGESRPVHARFSPDGKWVVYECTSGGNPDVYVMEVQTKQIRRLTDWLTEEGSPVWSLDGNHIVFSSNRRGVWDLLEMPMEQGRPKGEPRLLKYDFGAYPKRVTRAGNIAFNVAISSMDAYSLDVNPQTGESLGQPVRLTKSFYGQYLRPAWSPDGKRVAYIRQGQWMLCIQTIATGQEECISTGMWPANQIFWSPDGEAVALTPRSKDGKTGVFHFSLSTRQLRPIVLCPNFSPNGFTPDGKEFVFYRPGEEPGNIAVDIETGKERKLALPEGFNSWTYDFSRDQARIAFVESEPNGPEKLVVSDRDFKDKHTVAQAKGINQPRWSPDGTTIAFLCESGLHTVAADGRWQTKVHTGNFRVVFPPAWFPDGRKLALTLSEGEGSVSEIAVIQNPFSESAGQTVGGTGSKADPTRGAVSASPAPQAKPAVMMHPMQMDSDAVYRSTSPDGRYLCGHDAWRVRGEIVIREVATGEERTIKPTKEIPEESYPQDPIMSPDNKTIAYYVERPYDPNEVNDFIPTNVCLIGADGSGKRVLYRSGASRPELRLVQWFPDGSRILALGRSNPSGSSKDLEIVSVSIEDGSVRVIKKITGDFFGTTVRISPDGKYVAYESPSKTDPTKNDIFAIEVGSQREILLAVHAADDRLLDWTPDGHCILFISDRLGQWSTWLLPVAQGKAQDTPKLVAPGTGNMRPIGFAQSGSYIYRIRAVAADIYTAGVDLTTGRLLSAPVPLGTVGFSETVDWSPDGKYLAYSSMPVTVTQSTRGVIRIRSLASGEERELANKLPPFDCLRWSRDGHSLLVSGLRAYNPEDLPFTGRVYRIDTTTGESTVLLNIKVDNWVMMAELSPDGKTLYYWQAGIIRRDISSGQEKTIFPCLYKGTWVSWALSPNGEFVVTGSNEGTGQKGPEGALEGGVKKVLLIPSQGGQATELVRWDREPSSYLTDTRWSPDGKTVLFMLRKVSFVAQNMKGINELWQVPAGGGEPRKIMETDLGMLGRRGFRVSPDGQQIAFPVGVGRDELWLMENFLPAGVAGEDPK